MCLYRVSTDAKKKKQKGVKFPETAGGCEVSDTVAGNPTL